MNDIIIGCLLLTVLLIASYQLLIPRFTAWQRQHRYRQIIHHIQHLYEPYNPFLLAKQASNGSNDRSLLYGEITVSALLDLLALISPTAHDVFYDLGSGAGKTLFVVKNRYPQLNVKGIEKLLPLHAIAENLAKQHPSFPITVECADFLEYDFSDATILLINATAFSESLWNALLLKLKNLKTHTKIIITSKSLPSEIFTERYAGMEKMSWGLCTTYIYEKR